MRSFCWDPHFQSVQSVIEASPHWCVTRLDVETRMFVIWLCSWKLWDSCERAIKNKTNNILTGIRMISSGSDICFLRSVIVRKLHFWKAPGKICELYVCLIKWFLSPLPSVSLMFLVFPVGHRWSWAVMWSCMTVILQMERDRAQFPNGTDIIFQILTIHIFTLQHHCEHK